MRKAITFVALLLLVSTFKMSDEVVTDPLPCIQEKCPTQYAECEKDPKCVPALQDCYKKCGSKESCWEFCLPAKGSQAAIDTAKCAHAQGCDKVSGLVTPQECIDKYCKKEEQACQNDRRCIMALSFCDNRCNTSVSCWKECLDHSKNTNATQYFNCVVDHDCMDSIEAEAMIQIRKHHGKKHHNKHNRAEENIMTALAVFTPEDCIKQYCSNEAQSCAQNPTCLNALNYCGQTCRDDKNCWTDCLNKQGSPEAVAFWKCVLDHNCLDQMTALVPFEVTDPETCMKEKCPNQYAACQKDSKCPAVLEKCQKKCGTKSSCWEMCLAGEKDQPAIDLAKCAHANGCDKQAEVKEVVTALAVFTPEDCIKQYCSNEAQSCAQNPTCLNALNYCGQTCRDDKNCWTDCLNKQGSPEAVAFWKCVLDHNCLDQMTALTPVNDPETCMKEKCPNEYAACQKDSKCPAVLEKCDKKCGTKASCWELCLTQENNKNAINLAKCAQAHDCQKAVEVQTDVMTALAIFTPEECIKQYCQQEAFTCSISAPCLNALNACGQQCQDNQTCFNTCIDKAGNPEASALWKCILDHDCLNQVTVVEENKEEIVTALAVFTPEECIKEHCSSQAQACGQSETCRNALRDCEHQCKDNQSCWTTCLSSKGNPEASAFWKCILDNNCLDNEEVSEQIEDPLPCIQEKCPTQYAECEKDPKCVPALQDCYKKCGSKESCWEFCLPAKGSQAAIDTAKCAHAQGCDKVTSNVHPFLQCMNKSCVTSQLECLYDKHCSKSLHKCSKSKFIYDLECLSSKSKDSALLGSWFHCAGEHFCI